MNSSVSSSEPTVREEKPALSFIVIVSVIIGAFFIGKKYIGTIPALIIAYIIYVFRDDLNKEMGDVLSRIGDVFSHDRP